MVRRSEVERMESDSSRLEQVLENARDYARCIAYNRYVIPGLVALGGGAYGALHTDNIVVGGLMISLGFFGAVASLSTSLGAQTYRAYKRTKRHITQFGRLDPEFVERYDTDYCCLRGIRLAARDAGLDSQLKRN